MRVAAVRAALHGGVPNHAQHWQRLHIIFCLSVTVSPFTYHEKGNQNVSIFPS